METILLIRFASWLHSGFIPASNPDNWERRDGSEVLHTNDLPETFLRENPGIQKALGKMGLLALVLLFCFSGEVNAKAALRPSGIATDTVRTDTLAPVGFRVIRKISSPQKSTNQ